MHRSQRRHELRRLVLGCARSGGCGRFVALIWFIGIVGEASGGCGGGEEREGPFPAEAEDAEEEVDGLEDGDGADAVVEVGGEEVPEEFGPEEALY